MQTNHCMKFERFSDVRNGLVLIYSFYEDNHFTNDKWFTFRKWQRRPYTHTHRREHIQKPARHVSTTCYFACGMLQTSSLHFVVCTDVPDMYRRLYVLAMAPATANGQIRITWQCIVDSAFIYFVWENFRSSCCCDVCWSHSFASMWNVIWFSNCLLLSLRSGKFNFRNWHSLHFSHQTDSCHLLT